MSEMLQKELHWLFQEKYGGKRVPEAERDMARLARGEHIDYVIGWVDFLGCKIDLRHKPLIPRPETEYWTEKAIAEIQRVASRMAKFPSRFPGRLRKRNFGNRLSLPRPLDKLGVGARVHTYDSQNLFPASASVRVLDMFAGSGCVGVAVLKHCASAVVDFAEKDKTLLKQIAINAKLNNIEESRYSILRSDIFSHIPEEYDFILANPPYVAEARKDRVQESVVEQEPYHAVFAGEDGLAYIKKFLEEARGYLHPTGKIFMEFDSPQKQAVSELLTQHGYRGQRLWKDQYGRWRYLTAQKREAIMK